MNAKTAIGSTSANREILLSSHLGDGTLRIAMAQMAPGEWWVMMNFPGRSSLTLSLDASQDEAYYLMELARKIGTEAIAYAAAIRKAPDVEISEVKMPSCKIVEGVFGRFILVNPLNPNYYAWSGSGWSAHERGMPIGRSQICNFETVQEAEEYASKSGLRIVRELAAAPEGGAA
jgi:hypothetical protein